MISKIDLFSPGRSIKQKWVADSEQELREAFAKYEFSYPTTLYGTSLSEVRKELGGFVAGTIYRYSSCD